MQRSRTSTRFLLPLVFLCSLLLVVTSCGGGPEASFGTGPDAWDLADEERWEMDPTVEAAYNEYLAEEAQAEYEDARQAYLESLIEREDEAAGAYSSSPIELFTASVNLNIRSGPGTNYSKVGLMRKGLRCEVASRNADGSWLEVYCGVSDTGWVSARFGTLETYAEASRNGTASPPWTFRTLIPSPSCAAGCAEQPYGCNVKGNIGYDSGEKIYHVPGCEYYEETTINAIYGERWFCTEQEAIANGWRKAYNCP